MSRAVASGGRVSRTVTVVGAGAAGLTAALRAAEAGARVTLLNAHPGAGLKILMSGGSRCNVTNREVEARDYHGGSRNVVARILRAFPSEATREWFESLGVPLVLEEGGKYFPASDDAQTVLDALLGACERAGVALECGARVVRMEREGAAVEARGPWRLGVRSVASSSGFSAAAHAVGGTRWSLPASEPERWIEAEAIVLATGGLSFPRTGCDGSGYALAAALGHTIVAPVPALTPLTSDDPLCVFVQGLALEAELTLAAGGKPVEAARGSLLFTHFGLSGPAALDLSRSWLRAEGQGERIVRVSFVPGTTREELLADWARAAGAEPKLTVRRWLGRRLSDRLVLVLCAEVGVGPARYASQVERARRAELVERLCARSLRVTGTLGYEKAEVTAGGVALDEVDASTLESRKAPGVFLCGEMLDVDGRLGGFNFQWAWSSGTVAGRAAGGGDGRGSAGGVVSSGGEGFGA
jgi:predicted flavoprotein YhiN